MLKLLFTLTFIHKLMNVSLTDTTEQTESIRKDTYLTGSEYFNPAWMDYCDPYHCNDYWREVCGLNRKNMKFRYFQSMCHLILNNQCANYRGSLKYDQVDLQYCRIYIMFLRTNCPSRCDDDTLEPLCAVSTTRGHTVLFANQCSLDLVNCKNETLQEYEEVDMRICEHHLEAKLNSKKK